MSKTGHDFTIGDHVVYPAHGVGQVQGIETGRPLLDGAPAIQVHRRLLEQSLRERAHVQPGATDDHRQLPPRPHIVDPRRGRPGKSTGAVPLTGLDEVEPVMRDRGAFLPGRLRGPDIEVAIHLSRIGRDHLDRQQGRERYRDRRLPDSRGPDDDGREAGTRFRFTVHRSPSRSWCLNPAARIAAPVPPPAAARSSTVRARRAQGGACRQAQ